MRRIALGLLALGLVTGTAQAGVIQIGTGSLTTNTLDTLDDAGPDGSRDATLDRTGASYSERFAGQTRSFSGDFDVLTGTPTNPLSLVSGGVNANLYMLTHSGNITLTGLGPAGTAGNGIGEGAVSVLFDQDQDQVGFSVDGSNQGPGTIQFFRRDGSLIGTITLASLADVAFAFEGTGGDQIAGISLTNFNGAGVGFDDFRYDFQEQAVPVPAGAVLFGLGMASLGGARLIRRRKVAA